MLFTYVMFEVTTYKYVDYICYVENNVKPMKASEVISESSIMEYIALQIFE